MSKDKAIQIISELFPPDAPFADTAAIGQQLLDQARRECGSDWRNESDAVLIRFAELCTAKDKEAA